MGYYTDYTLKYDAENGLDNFETNFEHITSGYSPQGSEYLGNWKWYNWETDMREISKLYPGVLLTLQGEGEEAGDLWTCYFKDGKAYKATTTITISPFDESKLK